MKGVVKEIEVELTPVKELFYSDQSNYGVYACETTQNKGIKVNYYNNFVINGVLPKLDLNTNYQAKLEETTHKKYGLTYNVINIKQDIQTTSEGQRLYLKAVLSEGQFDRLIKYYPNDDIISLIKSDKLDYKKIKGFGKKTYSKIRKKVMDNLEIQEALIELSKYGVTYNAIIKLLKHYENTTILVQKINANPYLLTEVEGFGFKRVDQFAIQSGVDKDSPFRILSCFQYVLEENEMIGHSWISKKDLLNQAHELLGIDENKIMVYIDDLDDNKDFYIDNKKVSRIQTFNYEKQINDKINDLLAADNQFSIDNVDDKIEEIEKVQGFNFTTEQKKAIKMAITNNVLIINGKAGTGKSTVLKGILTVLSDYSYDTCALSGKASQRIVETGLESKTIHRLLGYSPQNGYVYNHSNPLPSQIIVLDEASMVNNYIFYKLITAIEDGNKFIILGDTEQLPPIGAANIFKDMIESNTIPKVEFTEVHRQAKKSGILSSANLIRDGKQITKPEQEPFSIYGELKDLYLTLRNNSEEIYQDILAISKKYANDVMDYQVIVPMKSRGLISTYQLNNDLQKIFNPNDKPYLKRGDIKFTTGDKVIKNGNDYENGVFNGTLGFITNVDMVDKELEIKFIGSDETVMYQQDNLKQIDLAYALTIHRTQGSQFKHTCMAIDYASYIMLSRQLVYTGLTRASKQCYLITEHRALRYAISNNDSSKRNTFLYDLLVSENS